jgi:hypothetical protein
LKILFLLFFLSKANLSEADLFEAIILDLNDIADENLKPKIAERTNEGNKHYDIHLCESYEDYNKYDRKYKLEKSQLEKNIYEHSCNYRKRWGKIKNEIKKRKFKYGR